MGTIHREARDGDGARQNDLNRPDSAANREVRGVGRRTRTQKLKLVLAAAELDEQRRGELLRREGVHSAQLEEWRNAALEALSAPKRSPHKSPEVRKIRELENDLDRKNRALAEVTALLALQKKVRAIWGDGDANTAPKNET